MTSATERLSFRCPGCGGINRVDPGRLADRPVCGRCRERLDTSGAPVDLDDDGLARLVRASPVPVLVDFWAPWCGPCRMVAPVVAQVARANAGRLIVAKVNTQEHARTSVALGVTGIPAFVLYRGGQVIGRQSGALPRPALEAFVGSALAG